MALEVTDANFEELVNAGKPMVLDFWAEWCGPCRMVSPIIDELATEYEGKVTIGKMDVDNNNDVVAQFGIRNIPTTMLAMHSARETMAMADYVSLCQLVTAFFAE